MNLHQRPNGSRTRVLVLALLLAGCSDAAGPRPAFQLAFQVSPADVDAGAAMNPAVRVAVLDSLGETVTSSDISITIDIDSNPVGGRLSGEVTAAATHGIATFSTLVIDRVSNGYTLVASAPGLASATSTAFSVSPGPAHHLAFTTQPATMQANAAGRPVTVTVQDAFDNTVTSAANAVSVWLATNPASGTLTGTTTVSALNGRAVFGDLIIDQAAIGFELGASASGLAGTTSVPFDVAPIFTTLSIWSFHACGTSGSRAYCWGFNGDFGDGRLGNGANNNRWTPTAVAGGLAFSTVAAGEEVSCAIATGGAAWCWGAGFAGELGNGGTAASLVPVAVSGGLSFVTVTVGGHHACGLTAAGAAFCWGFNSSGQLGDSSTTNRLAPVPVAGGNVFSSITAGLYSTCALTPAGAALCWGDEAGRNRTVPEVVAGGLIFRSLVSGAFGTCGVTTTGSGYCWGANGKGQLGTGNTTGSLTPVPVTGGLTFASITGGSEHACGVTTSSAAYCWGANASGELGTGTTVPSLVPVPVSGGLHFSTLGTGSDYTCGLTLSGSVYCWGGNRHGQLGNDSVVPSLVPVPVVR